MARSTTAIPLTEVLYGPNDLRTQKIGVPVTRMAKWYDDAEKFAAAYASNYRKDKSGSIAKTAVTLRTPEEHIIVAETVEQITKLMNGEG